MADSEESRHEMSSIDHADHLLRYYLFECRTPIDKARRLYREYMERLLNQAQKHIISEALNQRGMD